MLPIRLELRNFLAYRAPDPVRFDGVHLGCLTGANGAGKSSMLDAITWSLWGKARAKRDDELVHLGQNDMYVQLDFEQEGTIYRVLRQRSRKGSGTGALELFSIADDGALNTLTEQSMRDTQARINRLLRLDYETFVHSAFLQQGRADAFTVKTPRDRKQILSDILGLARWEAYEDAAKAELRSIDSDINIIEGNLRMIDEELRKEPHLKATLKQAEAAQAEAQAALDIAEKSLKEVETARADLQAAKARGADIDARVRSLETELQGALGEMTRQQERIIGYEATISRRTEIEAGYGALQAARDADATLGDQLMQLKQIDDQQNALERGLDAARAQLTNDLSVCEAEINALHSTIANAHPDDLEETQGEIAGLQATEARREQLLEMIGTLEQESAGLGATNRALKTEMDAIKKRLDNLNSLTDAQCPLCGQPLTDEHRVELLAEVEAEGKQRGDAFRANKTRLESITAEITTHRAELSSLSDVARRLQMLGERAAVLRAGVDAASNAAAALSAAETRAETLRGQLASEAYAQDVRAQLGEVAAQRAALGYDSGRHSAARADLQTYREYEAQRTHLEVALNGLPDAQAALQNCAARRTRLDSAIADEATNREALLVEIAGLEVKAREQIAREDEVRKQRALERQAYQRLINAQQELKTLDDQRKRKIELEARKIKRQEDQALYVELRDAFSKKGIPAMIIETAIPELESAANRLLMRMTDGRMQLKLETQREKITGGVAETLDIHISDEIGTRSYELYSGGEAFRINFALRVALSQLLSRRAGAQLRTLFIDEGFGTQDEDGRNKLVEAITAIQDDFHMILVVTHIDDLRDSFPVHLMVNKTSDGSYISLR
jgi:exonuclease SbcC